MSNIETMDLAYWESRKADFEECLEQELEMENQKLMSEIKNTKLERSNIISIVGAMMGESTGQCCIVPVQKAGLSNTTTSSGSGEYNGGDRVIGQGAYGVDGDLLLTTGWGDGCAIRRLNNDGTMTLLYHDNNALYRHITILTLWHFMLDQVKFA